jgi:hypothetical protein
MPTSTTSVPDLTTLRAGLMHALDGAAMTGSVNVLNRQANGYAGAGRSEILTCRFADGSVRRLFCKYEAKDSQVWSDVAYEAEVYRQVLQLCPGFAPTYFGSYHDAIQGKQWLVLEYFEGGTALDELSDPDGLRLAAEWLGRFHAAQEVHADDSRLRFLKRYDADYYLERARQALRCGEGLGAWLSALCRRFETFAPAHLEERRTVVHGDFYPHNLLLAGETVCPIDWEMAGIDLGEADLVCLVDGWPEETEEQCVLAYRRARWPKGAPPDCAAALGAAQLCLFFYHLAACPDWTRDPQGQWYGRRLRGLGEKLGLI